MILNIVIGNTDDHPLNHLFFWDGERLSLAPAFDVEPQIDQVLQHSMQIGPEGSRGTIDNALAVCGECRERVVAVGTSYLPRARVTR